MEFVFTVTVADPGRAGELRAWLRDRALTPAPELELELELPDGPDGRVVRFRSHRPGALVLYADGLVTWLTQRGPGSPTLTVTVEMPPVRRSVELTGGTDDPETLVRLVSALSAPRGPGPVTGLPTTGDTDITGSARHTSPGPVLDPDDDWDRE
ncbi:hypothetical protein [Streptomyces sp. NPDC127190]|uniref:hypothetical protein n=1 Tax=unclassified Streptomyces TaxID=2593676 RepID=UPI003629434A